jgi:hypothetical protein
VARHLKLIVSIGGLSLAVEMNGHREDAAMGLRTWLGLKRALVVPELRLAVHAHSPHPLASKVDAALRLALAAGGDRLPGWLLAMPGLSGRKYRRFINALIASLESPKYLEIGCYTGSTACSALYGNRASATLIDNWSQYGGRKQFDANLASIASPDLDVAVIEKDFRTVDATSLGAHDVYLFDGPHAEADQRDGIVNFQTALAENHVLIVDDWNWPAVRTGTQKALEATGCVIHHAIEIRTTADNAHAPVGGPASDWHNGYMIACVRRPS